MVKPLRVALLVKNSPSTRLREGRNMGYWSYGVDEFIWDHFIPSGGDLSLDEYSSYDVVVQEDAGGYRVLRSPKSPPLVYICIDSTLSEQHYKSRYERARHADLILVDHDDLLRFKRLEKPVRRLTYCVNNMLFHPARDKDIDLNFHCGAGASRGMPGGQERVDMRQYLGKLANECGWRMVSGGVGLDQYAEEMNRSKVVVNLTRTPINRSHRIFDALASGACLVTNSFPLQDCGLIGGWHYRKYGDYNELRDILEDVLLGKAWRSRAGKGMEFVLSNHTWEIRAQELRMILAQELKI